MTRRCGINFERWGTYGEEWLEYKKTIPKPDETAIVDFAKKMEGEEWMFEWERIRWRSVEKCLDLKVVGN